MKQEEETDFFFLVFFFGGGLFRFMWNTDTHAHACVQRVACEVREHQTEGCENGSHDYVCTRINIIINSLPLFFFVKYAPFARAVKLPSKIQTGVLDGSGGTCTFSR